MLLNHFTYLFSEKYKNNFLKRVDKIKKLGRKKKLSKEVKRLAKILNANPSLIASASNRKLLKLKKKNKGLKEAKSMEHRMKLRHQKAATPEKDISPTEQTEISKLKSDTASGVDKELQTVTAEQMSSNSVSESENAATPPCLMLAAVPENSEQSTAPSDPPSLQAHVSDSKDDNDMSNWRSLPRRAKRPAPTSPVKKPPKKRRTKVFLCLTILF